MPDPIVVPPIVSATVTAALTHRHAQGGLAGVTRTAALTAVELAQSPITSPEVVRRVADWHTRHPDHTTPDGRSTPLAGIWGGRAGRDWALEMAGRLRTPRTAAAQLTGGMIALYPDDPEALALPDGDPAEELHLTLAFVAEDASALTPEATAAIQYAATAGARVRSEPLVLEVVGFGQLGDADPPASVLILQQSQDAGGHHDGAAKIAHDVREVLEDFDSGAFPTEHDSFIPHLSVGYGVSVESLQAFVGRSVTFSAGVAVTLGGETTVYPWNGDTEAKAASIDDPLPIIREIPSSKKRAKLKRLSKRLNTIDRDLRSKLAAGAEVAMADGLRRAGVKVTQRAQKRSKAVQASVGACSGHFPPAVLAAAGITEQEALAYSFDAFGEKADRWITAANKQKRRAFVDEFEYEDESLIAAEGRWDAAKGVAVGFLLSSLTALAIDRLTGDPVVDTEGEQAEGDVPLSIIGASMAMADGRPLSGPGSDGPGEMGEGEMTVDRLGSGITADLIVQDSPEAVMTLTWVWGGSDRPFEPHMDLDGTTATVDDIADVWAKDGDWPDNGEPYYSPMDHLGCSCAWDETFDVPEGGAAE